MTEVLYVGLGTTGGWRHADRLLAGALREHGARVHGAWPRPGALGRLRMVSPPLSVELVEGAGVGRALRRRRAVAPDVVVVSSATSLLALPRRLRARTILWTDTPLASARPGLRLAPLRARERQVTPQVALVAVQPTRFAARYRQLVPGARVVPLPVPVAPLGEPSPQREAAGLVYAANPAKKGLDLAVAAWRASGTAAPLWVTGIEPSAARGFLRDRDVDAGPEVELLGRVSPDAHRALSSRAAVYLSCSRREEYGNAQLEGLMDGAVLVSGPCEGPAEPRALAREVDASFVTGDAGALGPLVARALALDPAARGAYQARARAVLADRSPAAFAQAVGGLLDTVAGA